MTTSLYVIVDEQNYIQAADMLSTDLSHIHNWSQNWAIKFNPIKTESVLFTRRNSILRIFSLSHAFL
jgi:hypothetical protein